MIWYHGSKYFLTTLLRSKSDPSSAFGSGVYLSPNKDDAAAWIKGNLGYVYSVEISAHARILNLDRYLSTEQEAEFAVAFDGRLHSDGDGVPGISVWSRMERRNLGNSFLKNIGYDGLRYAIERGGKTLRHIVWFHDIKPISVDEATFEAVA